MGGGERQGRGSYVPIFTVTGFSSEVIRAPVEVLEPLVVHREALEQGFLDFSH